MDQRIVQLEAAIERLSNQQFAKDRKIAELCAAVKELQQGISYALQEAVKNKTLASMDQSAWLKELANRKICTVELQGIRR